MYEKRNPFLRILSVARRECGLLLSTPIYIFCMVVFPILTVIFFTSLMDDGLPQEMPIGIVDLDNSTVMSQTEKDPSFSQFYSEVSRLRDYITSEEDKTKYEDITYNDFREFYNSYSSEVYCDEIKQQADGEYDEKMMTPMNARVDSVKEVWTKFIDEHAIEKYITITTHNMFYGSPGSYHPAWYYRHTSRAHH